MAVNKNIVSKEVRVLVEKAMNKTERRLFKANKAYAFVVISRYDELKRWGKEVYFTLTTASGAVGRNSLVSSAWNDDENKAWDEARKAIAHFVYGNKDEYKIRVVVIEKGDHPWWHWDINVDKQSAINILSEAFGTKAEVYGENFILTQSPTLRALSWEEDGGKIQYDLDTLKSRHSGSGAGCFWTEWE